MAPGVVLGVALSGCGTWNPEFEASGDELAESADTADSGPIEDSGEGESAESGPHTGSDSEAGSMDGPGTGESEDVGESEGTNGSGESDLDEETDWIDEGDTGGELADIKVAITADNAYRLIEQVGGFLVFKEPVENQSAGEIFGCEDGAEFYSLPGDVEVIYIAAWSDTLTSQGLLGSFQRHDGMDEGAPVYTGDQDWEVCATGLAFNPGEQDGGPSPSTIEEQLDICDDGAGDELTTSVGWVDADGTAFGALAVGETNDTDNGGMSVSGNEFKLACEVAAEARWMWFNWEPNEIFWPQESPFLYPLGGGDNPTHQFLIFRLVADAIANP